MESTAPLPYQTWQQQEQRFAQIPLNPAASPPSDSLQTPSGLGAPPTFSPGYFVPSTSRYRPPLSQFNSFDSETVPSSYLSNPHSDYSRTHSRAGSASALLSPGSSFAYAERPTTPDPHSRTTPQVSLWDTRLWRSWNELLRDFWSPQWTMFLFLGMGLIGAAAHHTFYASLDGREATDQLRMLRYGAAFSFFAKAFLCGAVIMAFRQRVWYSVRRRVFSVDAVDSLFAASEDMTAIFNLEVFKRAKLAMSLAIFVWLTPLVVILTSDTLTVHLDMLTDYTNCRSVRTLNFTHEEKNDWRQPRKIADLFELSLSWWNTTSIRTADPNFFDYYTAPSQQFLQIATMSGFLKHPIARESSAAEICGPGWNCSFVVNFTAPGYRCEELASGIGTQTKNFGRAESPLNTSMLIPEGDFSYYALTDRGDYAASQADTGDAGIPKFPPPFPPHLGAFRTEPVIWIGYTVLADPGARPPNNASDPRWRSAFIPKIFGCEHSFTSYTVQFNYTSGGTQSTRVLNRAFLAPVIDTTFQPGQLSYDGTLDNTTAIPETQYVLPQETGRYRLTGAYHSLGLALRGFLQGSINASQMAAPITKTSATQTRLVDLHTYLPVAGLMEGVQGLYEDIILSLFSNPQFLAVSWAADPSQVSGTIIGGPETAYPCVRERGMNLFRYHMLDLWLVYGAAILLACIGVGFGLAAVYENGGLVRGTRFSNIVEATRGSGLDRLGFMATRNSAVKLGYGLISKGGTPGDSSGVEWEAGNVMYGFGVEGEVRQPRSCKRNSALVTRVSDKEPSW